MTLINFSSSPRVPLKTLRLEEMHRLLVHTALDVGGTIKDAARLMGTSPKEVMRLIIQTNVVWPREPRELVDEDILLLKEYAAKYGSSWKVAVREDWGCDRCLLPEKLELFRDMRETWGYRGLLAFLF